MFCYNVVMSPRKSGYLSPRKRSPSRRDSNGLPSVLDMKHPELADAGAGLLSWIPERDWRLLAALARKRDEDDQRNQLADQLRRLWQEEKHQRKMVEAESSEQYKRYISEKRKQEQMWLQHKRLQNVLEQELRKGQLVDCIKQKERRSADLLAWKYDKQTVELWGKAVEEESKALLAADRRSRLGETDEWRRKEEVAYAQKKARDAEKRRRAKLRDASKRLAISNAINSWETSLLRHELLALEAGRRASHAASAALTEQRAADVLHARSQRQERAKTMAAITAQLRDAVRGERT